MPHLILVGDKDPITPVVCAEEIMSSDAQNMAQLEIFANAGHGVHRDDPDGAEIVLRRFLAVPA